MPTHFDRTADITQGFNFDKTKKTTVGFITKLKIGETEFDADLKTILDPETPTDKLAGVVGVLSSFSWDASTVGSMYFSGQLSSVNRQKMAELLLGSETKIDVTFSYTIYEYDPNAKTYFKSSFADEELQGLIEKNGDALNIDVADDPSHEVQSPQNYAFTIGIKPQPSEQSVNVAVGVQKNFAKTWGITEAA